MKKRELKTKSLEQVIDKYIGKPGSKKRETFEDKLSSELLTEEQNAKRKNLKIKHKVNKELLTFESEGIVVNRLYVLEHTIEMQLGEIKLSTSFKINELERNKANLEELLLVQHLLEAVSLLLRNEIKNIKRE
jgi:DNA polymerase elongation subunit (family B)